MNTHTKSYRGRLAPSPTGRLHAGHFSTFKTVYDRCQKEKGTLIYRDDDLDQNRCSDTLSKQAMTDIANLGIHWQEGPNCGGDYGPYSQKKRLPIYLKYFQALYESGKIYPCYKSRKEIKEKEKPAHVKIKTDAYVEFHESIFPIEFRKNTNSSRLPTNFQKVNWRLKIPYGQQVDLVDNRTGSHQFICGNDFGDFLVWRKDGFPSYEFATVIDDYIMKITEVVRGEDLLLSTARQILIYNTLEWTPPEFYHCPLVLDSTGKKLSKRNL